MIKPDAGVDTYTYIMKIIICLIVMQVLSTLNAVELPYRPKMLQFCGKKLKKALELVCEGTDINLERELEMLRISINQLQNKKGPNKLSQRFKRDYDVSIVDTCCQKSCNLEQLREYC